MRFGNPGGRWLRRGAVGVTLVSTAALAATTVGSPAQAQGKDKNLPDRLVQQVRVDAVLAHLDELQAIADRNGGSRHASSAGYDASVEHVTALLRDAGYQVTVQEFPFVYTEELRETLTVEGGESIPVDVMTYSGATPEGGVTGALATVAEDGTPGCEASDFDASFAGAVALVQRGGCTFAQKAQNAEGAGAITALVYNNDATMPDEPVNGTLGAPDATSLPTGGISLNAGKDLRERMAAGPVSVTVDLEELRENRTTTNVLAETRGGDAGRVVMAGAHLDSVNAGPGINDNGSGSSALLETALQLSKHKPANKVRFAWWGAEEFGLLGSEHYVADLSEAQRDEIALYLNFDMIGSPNGIIGIYDGDDSDAIGAGAGPEGSAQVEDVFERYFDDRGLAHIGSDFTGRSDYGPFLEFGIPAGGLATGSDGQKTQEQVDLFGGVVGPIWDPCYHQACDSMTPVEDGADADLYAELDRQFRLHGNVNVDYLEQMADAMAYAVGTFAQDVSSLEEPPAAANPDAVTGRGIEAGEGHHHEDES
ncbi:MAG TPA: M28 family metallopeptidase [Nocardioidaceae bacterium]|nr:M28 family metallopeptidase [Nocardioidaceae bacterium]